MISKKQSILKELRKIYDARSYGNENYTEIGKSLSRDELNIKTGIRINELDNLLQSLKSEEYIDCTEIEGKGDIKFYYLTPKGHNALSDRIYTWRLIERLSLLITFLISVFATLNSIFGWVKLE